MMVREKKRLERELTELIRDCRRTSLDVNVTVLDPPVEGESEEELRRRLIRNKRMLDRDRYYYEASGGVAAGGGGGFPFEFPFELS